ncbi:hypothetical protein BDV98DRAFT_560029 [Pterulicium gracile]|uniref:Uncharacterized protein n=1 Tax=Pterulicium gracile TaxID=1884261 RepID=A0A5C3QXV8_9AGAR|nr:hypothetical protein BDV98DRAFT_560029 [Pterula gracilis]
MTDPSVAFAQYNARILLGQPLSSKYITHYIESLTILLTRPTSPNGPHVATYRDSVYFNYRHLGLSLLFTPQKGYQLIKGTPAEDLDQSRLFLDGIDFYNVTLQSPPSSPPAPSKPPFSPTAADHGFRSYPVTPIKIHFSGEADDSLQVQRSSTGKYFVEHLGEPDRKGGGAGPSNGSIGIWCEWTKKGIMVEFGGNEARGPDAWNTGKDAKWKVISMFPIPK